MTQQARAAGGARRLSVIVPVRDHAWALERCLDAIRVSARGRDGVDVLVVDAGSVDGSVEVARRAGIEVLEGGPWTAAQARNAGAAAARGELLAFVDADVLIGPSWIDAALETFAESDAAAAGAWPSPPADANRVQAAFDLLRPHADAREPARWLDSGNFATRRRAFERVGGFDPTFVTCEDAELSQRMRRRGMKLLFEPRLAAAHLGDPRTIRGVFLAELWRGRDNLRATLRAHRARDMISGILPAVELAALAACLAPSRRLRRGALGFVASMTTLRALRMVLGRRPVPWRLVPTAIAVAGAYELSRALAIAVPVPYLVRRVGGAGS